MRNVIALFAFGLFASCTSRAVDTGAVSALQVREFQTRTYDTSDGNAVTRAVLNALQDDAFVIKTADVNIGLIVAAKEVDAGRTTFVPWSTLKDTVSFECSANVSPYGSQTRVRLNCQVKRLRAGVAAEAVQPIDDFKFYQGFFERVDKSIFIQKERL